LLNNKNQLENAKATTKWSTHVFEDLGKETSKQLIYIFSNKIKSGSASRKLFQLIFT
jgi:hypothetical protein